MGYVEGNNAMFADWKKLTGRVPGKTGYDTAAIEIDHANTVFIRDGVVCPELWFAQRTRPLVPAQGGVQRRRGLGSC